jgi:hypothetical protein
MILEHGEGHLAIEDKRGNLIAFDWHEDRVTIAIRQEHGDLEYVHLTPDEARVAAQLTARWYGVR